MEKAYKILAIQEGLSNKQAKEMIDAGMVSLNGKTLELARGVVKTSARFKINYPKKSKLIFEDEKIIAVDKAAGVLSEVLEKEFDARLLNRLDRQTSGVILLTKDDDFAKEAILEYKNERVYKCYLAVVAGVVAEEIQINEPLLKEKNYTKISKKGKMAQTTIFPLMVEGKRSLVRIEIKTGRMHQIRVHANYAKHGIVGDMKYSRIRGERMFLHSYQTKILGYDFKAPIDGMFGGFLVKNLHF